MRDVSATDPLLDDLDAMIDEVAADPSRAAFVKARIRARFGRTAHLAAPGAPRDAGDVDAEDLWDNLPF